MAMCGGTPAANAVDPHNQTIAATSQGTLPIDSQAEFLGWLAASLAALRAAWTALRVTTGTRFAQRAAEQSTDDKYRDIIDYR